MMKNQFVLGLLLITLLSFLFSQSITKPIGDYNSDLVKNIPGLKNQPKYKIFSGYIKSTPKYSKEQRFIHYVLVESSENPSKKPITLWTNGGPGCSSKEGFFTEHGPFSIQIKGRELKPNKYSWNKISNMLYVDQPAGVGYSYSLNSSKIHRWNDDEAAQDIYHFLINFYEKFPHYNLNDLYLSGESYGGRYIPTMANAIHEGNIKNPEKKINLKGLVIGNGCTDEREDAQSQPFYLYSKSMIPKTLYDESVKICKNDFFKNQNEPKCKIQLSKIQEKIKGMNVYWMYDQCPPGPNDNNNNKNNREEYFKQLEVFAKKNNIHPLFAASKFKVIKPTTLQCVNDDDIEIYLNLPEVKRAFHAKEDIKFDVCNMMINSNYDWSHYNSMLPLYKKLMNFYKIFVYTGDSDIVVNSLGTQIAIYSLNKTVTKPWRSWRDSDDIVAGKVINFENNLTFLTVAGAGHMTPTYRPKESFDMFNKFINNLGF